MNKENKPKDIPGSVSKLAVERRKTRQVKIGDVPVGGGAPIVVQSMTKTHTKDIKATVDQIKRLEKAGCEVVRLAVPDRLPTRT